MATFGALQTAQTDHYATLGLHRNCTAEQIRAAYRLLAKQLHPDINPSPEAHLHTQALNLAYEILSDPARRELYDRDFAKAERTARAFASKTARNLSQDLYLRIDEFLRGTSREIRISDPANPNGAEVYELIVPAETAPGTCFRLQRNGGGVITIRLRSFPHFQFKVRGSDLRCDLKITARRAAQGGEELVSGAAGNRLRVKIKTGTARGEIVRIPGEGLPKPRGGPGDLLVRMMYRPDVRISRPEKH